MLTYVTTAEPETFPERTRFWQESETAEPWLRYLYTKWYVKASVSNRIQGQIMFVYLILLLHILVLPKSCLQEDCEFINLKKIRLARRAVPNSECVRNTITFQLLHPFWELSSFLTFRERQRSSISQSSFVLQC